MKTCPDRAQLESLLADRLDETDILVLDEHLEICGDCNDVLTELSNDPEVATWCDVMRRQNAQSESAGDQRTIQRLMNARLDGVPAENKESAPSNEVTFPGPPTSNGPLGRIDHYHIIERVGAGGMGIVYRAFDDQLQRTVAIKILAPELTATEDHRNRFRREARQAAQVRHDNVVEIYEVHDSTDFVPYIVMEWIAGETLSSRLNRHKSLPQREVATIASEIAMGLAAAHKKGLVHRDIKPSNIMLDSRQGRARITDFGLARQQTVANDDITRTGILLGTPAYMSVEQIRTPKRVDGRSDIYSLGVVMYESLTGEQPFRGASDHDILMQVVHSGPLSPRRLNEKIPRDLETICLKCLEKEVGHRYQSAAEFDNDLTLWLSGKPILTRPISAPGRMWRWCRRNPVPASALSVAVTALLVTAIVACAWAIDASLSASELGQALAEKQTEYDRAEANLVEADLQRLRADENRMLVRNEVDEFLSRFSEESIFDLPGSHPIRRAFLERAYKLYERIAAQPGSDPGIELDKGKAYARMAMISNEMGQPEDARGLYQHALRVFETLARTSDGSQYRINLAICLNHLGSVYLDLDQRQEAERCFTQSEEIASALISEHPQDSRCKAVRATAIAHLGVLNATRNDLARALDDIHRSHMTRVELAQRYPENKDYQLGFAKSCGNLANVLQSRKQLEDASEYYKQGIKICIQLIADSPNTSDYRSTAANLFVNYGVLLGTVGKEDEMLAKYEQALALLLTLRTEHPSVVDFKLQAADAHLKMAKAHEAQSHPDVARREFESAEALFAETKTIYPKKVEYKYSHGICLASIALFHRRQGDIAKCAELMQDAVGIFESLHGEQGDVKCTTDLASGYLVLAQLSAAAEETEKSLQWCNKAVALLDGIPASMRPSNWPESTYQSHLERARLLTQLERYPEAIHDWDAAVDLATEAGVDPANVRATRLMTLAQLRRYSELYDDLASLAAAGNFTAKSIVEIIRALTIAAQLAANDPDVERQERQKITNAFMTAAVQYAKGLASSEFKERLIPLRDDKSLKLLHENPEFQQIFKPEN